MADRTPPEPPVSAPDPGAGLRVRLWLACLVPPLLAGGLLAWVVTTRASGLLDPALVWLWLPAIGGLGVVIAIVAALWIDRHVVGHLGGLLRGLQAGRVTDLRGLPSATGWGELSELTHQTQVLLVRQRAAQRSIGELEALHGQLAHVRVALDRWNRTERWEPLTVDSAALAPVISLLNRSMGRDQGIRDENAVAARQVRDEIHEAVADARESAEQAERGFVEATALLTTVRELHRLGGDLTANLGRLTLPPATAAQVEAVGSIRATAAAAIGDLVTASVESVEHLGTGMQRVQEITDHVQRLANRATLIALNVVAAGAGREPQAEQLKRLARDVREATERTTGLATEVESEVAAATERMARVRAEIAARLEALPATGAIAESAPAALPEDAARLLERVREMINDATRKGERLSSAGERASRAAQRLTRRLDDEARELDGLIVRLEPVTGAAAPAPTVAPGSPVPTAPAREGESRAHPASSGSLRLLGREGGKPAEPPRARGEEAP